MRVSRQLGPRRAAGTNPRAAGTDLRSRNLNPRVLGTNPRAASDAHRKAGEALQTLTRAARHRKRIDARQRSRGRLGGHIPGRYNDSAWRRWKVDYLERARCDSCEDTGWVHWDDDGRTLAQRCEGPSDGEPP